MEILIVMVAVIIVMGAAGVGYQAGRNDGYDKGWKDCEKYCGGWRPKFLPPVPWWKAVGAIKACCEKVDECDDCPMLELCWKEWRQAPANWQDECVKTRRAKHEHDGN